MKAGPAWRGMVKHLAHTVPYDSLVQRAYAADPGELARIRIPTLLLLGAASPSRMRSATEIIAQRLPAARISELAGQDHVAMLSAPAAFAAAVNEFLNAPQREQHTERTKHEHLIFEARLTLVPYWHASCFTQVVRLYVASLGLLFGVLLSVFARPASAQADPVEARGCFGSCEHASARSSAGVHASRCPRVFASARGSGSACAGQCTAPAAS